MGKRSGVKISRMAKDTDRGQSANSFSKAFVFVWTFFLKSNPLLASLSQQYSSVLITVFMFVFYCWHVVSVSKLHQTFYLIWPQEQYIVSYYGVFLLMIITYVLYQRALIYDKCSESFTVVLFESVDLQTKSTSYWSIHETGEQIRDCLWHIKAFVCRT